MDLLNIIIVNWNSGESLQKCVQSIFNSDLEKSRYHVYVVDNNSTDNSVDLIMGLSTNLTIIRNKVNVGFGSANNIVLEKYISDFVLLLNPDVILYRNTLSDSLAFMENNNNISVLGVKNYDLNKKVVPSCARFPSLGRFLNDIIGLSKIVPKIFKPGTIMTDWDHRSSREVNHVIGAYMLIRTPILKQVGYFDENFFLYLEDLDLSKRIVDQGSIIYYNSDISIIHEGGGTTKSIKEDQLFYSLQSRIIYCKKHFNSFSTLLIFVSSLLFEPISRTIFIILKGNFKEIIPLTKAYKKYFNWIKRL